MKATELLIRQMEKAQEGFLDLVAKVPDDKLDWAPGEGTRSALDQFQEVATILGFTWGVFTDLTMEFSEQDFHRFLAHRKTFADRAACEAELRRWTSKLIEFVRSLRDEDLDAPVQLPFPGDWRLADCVHYHVWNLYYHTGQITAILQRLGLESRP